ncbi:hypothetical protein OUZ56_018669 [Daphnia magna]|uniref:Uncharacterized protein n=1 Tax=Daphnia magna TaxID=35525 RepID=A0ABQ9ZAL2_9CRUS|nr:hypothetical protein OUZ56_018669 [Daphnia magna]
MYKVKPNIIENIKLNFELWGRKEQFCGEGFKNPPCHSRSNWSSRAAGDLHLQGWISNSVEFLNLLSVDVKASLVEERSFDGDHEEKVLGVYWNPTTYVLTFKESGLDTVVVTRVG